MPVGAIKVMLSWWTAGETFRSEGARLLHQILQGLLTVPVFPNFPSILTMF